jgi:hypothetical protein
MAAMNYSVPVVSRLGVPLCMIAIFVGVSGFSLSKCALSKTSSVWASSQFPSIPYPTPQIYLIAISFAVFLAISFVQAYRLYRKGMISWHVVIGYSMMAAMLACFAVGALDNYVVSLDTAITSIVREQH